MSGRDDLQTVRPSPRRGEGSHTPGGPEPSGPLQRLAAQAQVVATKVTTAVAALLAWIVAVFRVLRARVESRAALWVQAIRLRAITVDHTLRAVPPRARAWLRPRVRLQSDRLRHGANVTRARLALGAHTAGERLTSTRARVAPGTVKAYLQKFRAYRGRHLRGKGARRHRPLWVSRGEPGGATERPEPRGGAIRARIPGRVWVTERSRRCARALQSWFARVRGVLNVWATAVKEQLGGAQAAVPPSVCWGQARLFESATAPPGRHQEPGARSWSFAGRAAGITAGGIAGMLVLVMLGSLLLPMAARSAVRSLELGIVPAKQAALSRLAQRSVIFAGDGSVLAIVHDEIDRKVVGLSSIPKHVQQAVITAEDRRFWEHRGYDRDSIARAFVANFRAGEIVQGGSTLTQQIAKSAVGNEQSLERKLNELAYAIALERTFTKEQLLERYLNQVYFGWGAYGIAAAAEEYFGVFDPAELRVEQGALLAGLIRSPGRLDPRRHPQEALARRNHVLKDMARLGYLTQAQADFVVQTPLGVLSPRINTPVDPYLVEAVRQEFLDNPAFGPDRPARSAQFFGGGLRIETSVDLRLQQIARDAVTQHLPSPNGPTAAIAAVDPRDGRILAIYGGSDFDQAQYNLATQGRRQPGSSFKPFVMATAVAQGYPTSLRLPGNSPLILRGTGLAEWSRRGVSNYGGTDYGRVDMFTALVKSVNTAFAQLITMVGTDPVIETARRMGIDIDEAMGNVRNPAIALGGLLHGVTPLEMASAYSTFANGGSHVPASLITKVTGPDGIVVYERKPQPERVLEPSVNATMVDVMQHVVTDGTGTRAQLYGWDAAGKTGTTTRNADAWFIGYVPVMSTAVWMGYPQGQIPMPGRTGGSVPAAIWRTFMARALEGNTSVAFPSAPLGAAAVTTGDTVTVPDLVGMSEVEAFRALAAVKLIGVARPVSSRSPTGTVVSQRPRAGSTAQARSVIRIGVSTDRGSKPQPNGDGGKRDKKKEKRKNKH